MHLFTIYFIFPTTPFTDMDHAAGHEIYTFLDGMSGYYQVYIRKEDQVYTTFTTDWGTFAFERMPFGLCNAPGTFQRIMMDIFHDSETLLGGLY